MKTPSTAAQEKINMMEHLKNFDPDVHPVAKGHNQQGETNILEPGILRSGAPTGFFMPPPFPIRRF